MARLNKKIEMQKDNCQPSTSSPSKQTQEFRFTVEQARAAKPFVPSISSAGICPNDGGANMHLRSFGRTSEFRSPTFQFPAENAEGNHSLECLSPMPIDTSSGPDPRHVLFEVPPADSLNVLQGNPIEIIGFPNLHFGGNIDARFGSMNNGGLMHITDVCPNNFQFYNVQYPHIGGSSVNHGGNQMDTCQAIGCPCHMNLNSGRYENPTNASLSYIGSRRMVRDNEISASATQPNFFQQEQMSPSFFRPGDNVVGRSRGVPSVRPGIDRLIIFDTPGVGLQNILPVQSDECRDQITMNRNPYVVTQTASGPSSSTQAAFADNMDAECVGRDRFRSVSRANNRLNISQRHPSHGVQSRTQSSNPQLTGASLSAYLTELENRLAISGLKNDSNPLALQSMPWSSSSEVLTRNSTAAGSSGFHGQSGWNNTVPHLVNEQRVHALNAQHYGNYGNPRPNVRGGHFPSTSFHQGKGKQTLYGKHSNAQARRTGFFGVPSPKTKFPSRWNLRVKPLEPTNNISEFIKWDGILQHPTSPYKRGVDCGLCQRDLNFTPTGALPQPADYPQVAVLPCGHAFHDHCLKIITPHEQSSDPPCLVCTLSSCQ